MLQSLHKIYCFTGFTRFARYMFVSVCSIKLIVVSSSLVFLLEYQSSRGGSLSYDLKNTTFLEMQLVELAMI